jgi:molybdopterin synthase catalytic subunit
VVVAERRVFKIVDGPIEGIALEDAVRTDADGAVIVFRGVARRFSRGRDVVHLEYEAYPEMAEKIMAQIGDEMKIRWPITEVAIVHRTGALEIGQASVAIAVSAPHRGEAFAAAQYAIDRLKQIVPIWKKEVWSDGSQWIGWENESGAQGSGVRGQGSGAGGQ